MKLTPFKVLYGEPRTAVTNEQVIRIVLERLGLGGHFDDRTTRRDRDGEARLTITSAWRARQCLDSLDVDVATAFVKMVHPGLDADEVADAITLLRASLAAAFDKGLVEDNCVQFAMEDYE